jgi:hypothetical protein
VFLGNDLVCVPTPLDPSLLDRLRVGPLTSHLDAYLKRIEQAGFLPSSVPIAWDGGLFLISLLAWSLRNVADDKRLR